jgi:hypothetical protein
MRAQTGQDAKGGEGMPTAHDRSRSLIGLGRKLCGDLRHSIFGKMIVTFGLLFFAASPGGARSTSTTCAR